MVAFLGCAMWVCLKKLATPRAPSLTPWQVLSHLRAIVRVDAEFATRDGRRLTLPRITEPEKEQAALLLQLGWTLARTTPAPHPRRPAARAKTSSTRRSRRLKAECRAILCGRPSPQEPPAVSDGRPRRCEKCESWASS